MFLNPNIRNKLILKQSYHNDMKNNQFAPDIIDDTIYLQEESTEIEYKKIVILGEKATKDLEDNDNIEITLPKKMSNKISEEIEELSEELSEELEVVDVSDEDKDKEDKEDENKEDKELFGGGDKQSNIKNIVVHSFF